MIKGLGAAIVIAGFATSAAAQTTYTSHTTQTTQTAGANAGGARLTLDDAIRIATEHSQTVAVAKAGEARAAADQTRARSLSMPQISFVGSYDRTLASEFSVLSSLAGPVCAPLAVNAGSALADRVTELERAASCGAIGPSFNFSELPFGQRNTYRMTFALSQPLYTAGRIGASRRQADLEQQSAALGTDTARATLALDVTTAFYDAALSDRLVVIAESGLTQASASYDLARQAFDAGRQSEFELLRAQVAHDNQRPTVIRAKARRDVAYLRLNQLLEQPAGTALDLDVNLDADRLAPPAPFAEALSRLAPADAAVDRTTTRQAEALVAIRDAAVTVARAERLPSASLSSSFGEVGYPASGALPSFGDFRTNWVVGAAVQIPVFTGRRLQADEQAARADLDEAKARLKQTRELADLDAASARQDLSAAEAVWQASAGTIQQARRAYDIADLRYREGLSTQLELSDSRLSLQVAEANRAQAARDLQVARTRVALLPALTIGGR